MSTERRAKGMRRTQRRLAGAALVCALALGSALFPAAPALAAAEEGESARTIPVAPVDPESAAGRIVHAIADWLEQRVGSGSDDLRLTLTAPMRAEEQDGTVTVHLPGAQLVGTATPDLVWALGDLAIAVTPRSETAYDFETAVPPLVEHPNGHLTVGAGTISGTWRSDLEVATTLSATLADFRAVAGSETAPPEMTLGALSLSDELVEGDDGLWDGRTSFSFSDLESEFLTLGGLEVASSFEDFDQELILQARRDLGLSAGGESSLATLTFALAPFLDAQWGRSEGTLTVRDLTVIIEDVSLGVPGSFRLGGLVWRMEVDDRRDVTDFATRLTVDAPELGGSHRDLLPPGLMPHAATIDIAVAGLPFRRIAEMFSAPAAPGHAAPPEREIPLDAILGQLDAADTSFELREIRVAAPSYEIRADGRFQVEPASLFGVIGRLEARIRGLGALMEMALAEGEEGLVAVIVLLQGLGRPVVEEGADEPFHAYELDLGRDGAVTVNGLPLDVLMGAGLSPP